MDIEKELAHLQQIADWMDSKFTIPGTSIRFGLDSLLGLIPGVGDTIGAAVTAYLIAQADRYQLPHHLKMRMAGNAFIDWFLGLIPFAGDIFDFGWKANQRNLNLIRKHLQDRQDKTIIIN